MDGGQGVRGVHEHEEVYTRAEKRHTYVLNVAERDTSQALQLEDHLLALGVGDKENVTLFADTHLYKTSVVHGALDV